MSGNQEDTFDDLLNPNKPSIQEELLHNPFAPANPNPSSPNPREMDPLSMAAATVAGEVDALSLESKERADSLASVRAIKPAHAVPPSSQPARSTASAAAANKSEFDISVSDPQTVGEGLKSYTVYRINTHTTSPLFASPTMTVHRRFREFLWLYSQLAHNNPGMFVPPPPEKQAVGRFDEDFVANRRIMLERMLRRIGRHSVLSKDPDFRAFLEMDILPTEDAKKRDSSATPASAAKSSSAGFMSKLGDAVSNLGGATQKVPEVDEWFDTKRAYIDSLEQQLKAVSKAIDAVIKHRDELAMGTADFAESCLTLATSELSKSVESHLTQFADAQNKIKLIHADQACKDLIHLANTIEEYLRLITSIKHAFSTRSKIYSLHLRSQSDLSKFKISLEKLKLTFRARPDKIAALEQDILEAEGRIVQTKKEFEDVSAVIKDEMYAFEEGKLIDMKRAMAEWVATVVDSCNKMEGVWNDFQQQD